MVIFKEDYDLTSRTPTPPAQRFQRMQARRRQQQHERHLASIRGKFDAKRKKTEHNEEDPFFSEARGEKQPQQQEPRAVTRWGGIQTGRSADELAAQPTDTGPTLVEQLQQQSIRSLSQHQGDNMSFSFNPNQPMQGIGVMQAPPVSNDSFSGFFGGVSMRQNQQQGGAGGLAGQAALAVADAIRGSHHHNHHGGQDDLFVESNPYAATAGGGDGGIPRAKEDDEDDYTYHDDDDDLAPPCGFDTLEDQNSLFIGEKRISGEDHFERYRFDVGADDIRDAAVVREFKKLVIDNKNKDCAAQQQQQQLQGQCGGAGSRVAARAMSARSVRRAPAAGGLTSAASAAAAADTNSNNHKMSREVNSLASCRQSADPKDHQDVIEGLLGTTERMTAPSAVEREAIRMLRVASASNNRGGGGGGRTLLPSTNSKTQQQQMQQHMSGGGSRGGDVLSARLTSRISGSRGRTGNSPLTPTTSSSAQNTNNNHDNTAVSVPKSAASSVPRPPPGFYRRVAGKAQNDARVFTAQAHHVADQLAQQEREDPNPLHHRPPFRLRAPDSAGFASNAKHLPHESPRAQYRRATSTHAEEEEEERRRHDEKFLSKVEVQQRRRIEAEKALQEDVQEDLRCFEWRRAAQAHAKQMAKVQVARDKALETFERRQCERFRDALARFEPGALQRTERAIQHRIAHELVTKYGPAAFLNSGSSQTDRDLAIPVSFRECAREAALVAAETARAEKQEEDRRRKRTVAQSVMQQLPPKPPSRGSSASPPRRRRFSSVSFGTSSAATAAAKPQPVPPKKRTTSMRDYVQKDQIESSGYGATAKRASSLLPGGRPACLTEEAEAFIGSARSVHDEIEALEQRCPGLTTGGAGNGSSQLRRG